MKPPQSQNPTINEARIFKMVNDVDTLKSKTERQIDGKFAEIDGVLTETKDTIKVAEDVIVEASKITKELDSKFENLTSEVVEVLNEIKTEGLKGDKGDDADEEAIEERLLAKIPKLETIVKELPTKEEIVKEVIKQIPENKPSLKVIQESIDIEEVASKVEEKLNEKPFEIDRVNGLSKKLDNITRDVARKTGYHGGGDTVKAGTNISIATDGTGAKVISATGSGTGSVTDVSVVSANGLAGTVANPTTTPAITLDITALNATKIADGSISNTEFQYLNGVSSNIQSQLDGKVDENAVITGATKTKITYDAKGLVTAGVDATTADIADSTNKRYVTDAQLTVIGNTSGTNTGDQTSIVGITGTKAQFDTAVTDGNFLYVGDITQYTDEMAQDAVGGIVDSSLVYSDATPSLSRAALTGDVTASAGSNATTIKNDVALGGSPTTTTQSAGDNTTKIATTAFVTTAVANGTVGLLDYRGSYDASTNLFPATGGSGIAGAILKGDFYICSVGGTLGGTAVTPGDLIIAIVDTPGQTAGNWDLIEHNLGTYVTDVTGTTNRITSTGGATPAIDISATFEALLGKVANPLSQFASTTSAQLAGVISDETGTGALVFANSPTLVTPALGTPSAVNLTNATGLPIAGLVSSTSTALGVGSLDVGHASDTTITRSSAGVIAVEGVVIPSISSTNTLTNKRMQPRTASSTTASTLTPDLSSANVYYRTTQTATLTINAPTGTPVIGETIAIYVDSAGAQTLTMDSTYKVFGAAFPATTTAGKTLMLTAQFNGTDWKTLWANAV